VEEIVNVSGFFFLPDESGPSFFPMNFNCRLMDAKLRVPDLSP
jgi:hypothetical protein